MRIIAGRFRSRRLAGPRDDTKTRPIPDRAKESLFGMLAGNCEGAVVLDAFAGTGAIGLEALSRGAERVVFVEREKHAVALLRANIEALGVHDEVEVVHGDAMGPAALARTPGRIDLAFFDPPYAVVLDPAGWERLARQLGRFVERLGDQGYLVLRTPWPFRHIELLDADGQPLSASERAKFDQYGRRRKGLPPPVPRIGGHNPLRGEPRGNDKRTAAPPAGGDGRREWIGDEIDAGAIQAESDAELQADLERDGAGPGVQAVRHSVALELPNAVGPETHVYASTAVHLYMRRRSDAGVGAGPGA